MNGPLVWVQMAVIVGLCVLCVKGIKERNRKKREKEVQESLVNQMKAKKAQRYLDWVATQEADGREDE